MFDVLYRLVVFVEKKEGLVLCGSIWSIVFYARDIPLALYLRSKLE
jgi:hypothetical protein